MTVFQPPPLFCFPLNTLCHHRRPVCGSWAQSRHRDGHGLVSDDRSRISAGGLTITFERRPHNPNPDQSPPPPPPPPSPPSPSPPPPPTHRSSDDGTPGLRRSTLGFGAVLFEGGVGAIRGWGRECESASGDASIEACGEYPSEGTRAHLALLRITGPKIAHTPGGFHEMIRDLAWRGVESTHASRAPQPSSIQVCGNHSHM